METWNKLTATREEAGGDEWCKEGERISHRTRMNQPWTWTTVRGWTVGARSGLGRGGQRGKIGTTVTEQQ